MSDLPEEFLEFIKAIKGKRSRIVVNHILEHGFVTTEELEQQYGYKHPPRAVRDVREQGVPIERFTVKDSAGRPIAAYRFGDLSQLRRTKVGGRKNFPKALKIALMTVQEGRCAICLQNYDAPHLQIDHRIPYEVAGEPQHPENTNSYMLLCGSCNRAKSWSCEHCQNGLEIKDPTICASCYWANPPTYTHIAMRPLRRIDLVWSGNEVHDYEQLKALSDDQTLDLPDYLKQILHTYLSNKR
jgi:5-methylcytosine-specific restriction endonuclease McrA